ncbi:hypothetical protein ACFVYD_12820 [Streptomyces sp. NPDC058301]
MPPLSVKPARRRRTPAGDYSVCGLMALGGAVAALATGVVVTAKRPKV